jgi:hypothetical protein
VQTRNAEASPLSRSPRPARPLRLIDPLEASKHQRRADTKRQLGQMAAALRYYDRAMELSPDNTVLRYLRGTARLEVGDITGAIEDLGAAVTLDPTNKQLGELLAYAQARSRSGRPLADPPHYLTSVPPPWTFHLFARNGDIRFAHPKWLVYRRGLATLAQCITPDIRSVFLLGDHGFFRDHLLRQFPHLHVESFAPLPGPVSSRMAAFPAQLNQWDMVVYVGFNVPLDERGVDLLSSYRKPETRVIAIVADARYADELRVPGVEIQLLQEKGTLFCYRTYQRMALGRARLYRRLARVPLPLKFTVPPVIATIALGTLVAGIAANTAGLAINRWSVARSSTRTKTFSLPVPGANKLRNPTVESRADNIEEPIRAQSRP